MNRPLRILEILLTIFLKGDSREEILGDFEERFCRIQRRNGIVAANIWYLIQIILSFPRYIKINLTWSFIMLKNYLKIAFRNIRKHKIYTFINISGLAIGMACCLLIFLWVKFELGYDRFHEKADRIYRIANEAQIGKTEINQTMTSAPLGPRLKADYPQVEEALRIYLRTNTLVTQDNNNFREDILFADSTFFDMFSFVLIKGDSRSALCKPNSVILTESTAKRIFGENNPVDKLLKLNGNNIFTVKGVMKDVPDNSHFHFDIVVSMMSDQGSYRNTNYWGSNRFLTYILLKNGASPRDIEAQLPDFVNKYIGKTVPGWDKWLASGNFCSFYLQPMTDIHLHSDISGEFEANGSRAYVIIFSVTGLFILIIACINFINLTTAHAAKRSREVGLRKVVGSTRRQLIRQFLGESLVSGFSALILGIIILEAVLPVYSNIMGIQLKMNYFSDPLVLPALTGFAAAIGIISGIYPSFVLSSYKPACVLKGNISRGAKNPVLRGVLVVFQFAASIILITGTYIVYDQLEYFQNKKPGFNKEQVVIVNSPVRWGFDSESFKKDLRQQAGIKAVAGASSLPGRPLNNIGINPEGNERITLDVATADYDYDKTLQLEMASGRFFSRDFLSDSSAIILNETAVKLLDWDNPSGKRLDGQGVNFNVIGVVKDYHYKSMHSQIRPMALVLISGVFNRIERVITVRIQPGQAEEKISLIKNTWKKHLSGAPFEYTFFDEEYNRLYENEVRTRKIFSFFSFVAIFIASLGLFGLASFSVEQRTKEIGIRKTLGASGPRIIILLIKEFFRWVAAANVIAWPVAWFMMNNWLQQFPYRVDIGAAAFLLALAISLTISLISIGYHTVKAASSNPVNALKYE